VHFATHAVVSNVRPAASALLLSGGSLCMSDVLAARLTHLDTVVLAGCRTADQTEGYGDLRSLAAAFLAAGARNVVGTLWDLDDEAGLKLSREFHRRMISGVSPAAALRSAQLVLLRSANPRLSHPAAWAGIEVFGRGN